MVKLSQESGRCLHRDLTAWLIALVKKKLIPVIRGWFEP